MAIKLGTYSTIPALNFDKLHINNFILSVDVNGKKHIEMTATPYAINPNTNERIFDTKNVVRLNTNDFDTDAMTYSLENGLNVDVPSAVAEYMQAVIDVQNELNSGLSVWKLMAYFEAALGKINEIKNTASFIGIE